MPPQIQLPTSEDIHNAFICGEGAVTELFIGVIDIVRQFQSHITELREEIRELRGQSAKNSGNSSKPPSSDGLKKKQRTASLRKSGEKPNGGQPGHKGHCLEMSDDPDRIMVHRVGTCKNCQASLKDAPVIGHDRRQVFDIPPLRMEITEHQTETLRCPKCGHHNKSEFPAEISQPVQYGSDIKAHAVYFNTYHHIPLERTSEIFEHLFGHRISETVIIRATEVCAAEVEPAYQHIRKQLIKSDVVNFDETGLRVNQKLHWLTVASAPGLTCYNIHPKRGEQGLTDSGILPEFHGIAVHDHWKAYFRYSCGHSLCNAHHLRELKFVCEQYGQIWAKNMSDLLTEIHHEVKKTAPYSSRLPPQTVGEFESRYDRIIGQGLSVNPPSEKKEGCRGRTKQSVPRNLIERLRTYRSETLRFMYDFRVPFDNNQAERDIRMMKVKQKVSGSFRTGKGAKIFCRIRSYISTLKKNACNIIDAIRRAFEGNPFIPITTAE